MGFPQLHDPLRRWQQPGVQGRLRRSRPSRCPRPSRLPHRTIHRAARNITEWLIEKKFRNVIIDIANEWDLPGEHWDFASYIRNYPTRWGNVRASRTNNLDLGIYKNFNLLGKVKLQFRFETYNTFNHARFAAPNSDPTSSSFGVVAASQQNAPRTIQMALKLSF